MRFTFKHQPRPDCGEAPAKLSLVARAAPAPSLPAEAALQQVSAALAAEQRLGVWCVRRALLNSAAGPWYLVEHALAGGQQAAMIVFQQPGDAAALMLRFADAVAELANLQHHNIVVPIDSGLTPQNQPFLVLPWVEAEPLLSAVENLGLRERLSLLLQLCDALAHAHSEGLLLNEFDPAHLWVLPEGRLQLMAVQLGREFRVEAPPEALHGYASPERLAGAPMGFGSEVYSVGALMRLLVTGCLPLQTAGATSDWPELSESERLSLDVLMGKAVHPQPLERHANAEALGLELRHWLTNPGAAQAPATRVEPRVARHAVPWWPRRFLALSVGLGLGLLVAGWVMHDRNGAEPASAAALVQH